MHSHAVRTELLLVYFGPSREGSRCAKSMRFPSGITSISSLNPSMFLYVSPQLHDYAVDSV